MLAVDCTPHATTTAAMLSKHHASAHKHVHGRPIHRVIVKRPVTPLLSKVKANHFLIRISLQHHIALRECPPGGVTPLAELTPANLPSLYVSGGSDSVSSDAVAVVGAPEGFAPAQPSGTDLPVPSLNTIGSPGGFGGVPSPGTTGVPSGGGPGGGLPGGGAPSGGAPGGGATPPVTTPPGNGGTPPIATPPAGGIPTPPVVSPPGGGVTGVPEPATWALMLLGVGAIGGFVRRERRGRAESRLA